MEELITYRLAGERDIDDINALYNRIYSSNRTTEKFSWEYNSAPAGKAIYVIAIAGNKIIGTQCAIPYYLVDHNSKLILSAKSEDTLVDPAFRGKQVFENMYKLLIDECRKANIELIWGFTYAVKPFKKTGFAVPFQSQLGLLVLQPFRAFSYYTGLAEKNTLMRKVKILGLCIKSWSDFFLFKLQGSDNTIEIKQERHALNTPGFNYIQREGDYGLNLDAPFLDYRLYTNPYSKNYFQYSFYDNG
ncbi:MAG: GNAT family N-acetyltransferase, partial [Bacteroidia bacterium]